MAAFAGIRRQAEMNKNQDKIKQALDCIEECLETLHTDRDWLNYITFQSLFYNYSFRNTILIYSQNPNATFVKGYKAWNRLGRYVKKGSKGVAILAPCFHKMEDFEEPPEKELYQESEGVKKIRKVLSGFKLAYVYDIADTEGSDEHLPVLVRGLAGNSEKEKEIYEVLADLISREYTIKELAGSTGKGSYNIETGVIRIRSDMGYLQKIKTLLHEYAHAIDFKLHPEPDISRNKRELIAESAAFVVSMRLGFDTSSYSISYIKSWLKDIDELKTIADTVQKVSAQIINNLAESSGSAFSGLKEEE